MVVVRRTESGELVSTSPFAGLNALPRRVFRYFTLWLKEYRQRHAEWMEQTRLQHELNNNQDFRVWAPQHSPSLALFYARAKQTFFTPNSPYELNLPSTLLAVFHAPNASPHPDPALFTDVAIETWRLLDESLRRFVSAQFNNVGNSRVMCGIVAGTVFSLAGFIPPITVNLTKSQSRWSRILAFPGLFVGLTIMIAALNGICMGVYFFGDFRQLRKFELARPQISKPQQPPSDEEKAVRSPSPAPSHLPPPSSTSHAAVLPSMQDARVAHFRRPSSSTDSEEYLTEESSAPTGGIHISPAFFDDSSFIDAETGDISSKFRFPPQGSGNNTEGGNSSDTDFTATAAFIQPFDDSSLGVTDEVDYDKILPEQRQAIGNFDFDALPPRRPKTRHETRRLSDLYERECCSQVEAPPPSTAPYTTYSSYPYPLPPTPPPSGLMERVQARCDIKKWRLQTEFQDHVNSPTATVFSTSNPYNAHIIQKSHRSFSVKSSNMDSVETKVNKRFKLMNAVPAFAVPLTRVLSPVVRRGQWEIVVRSALIAIVLSWVIVGSTLAIPVPSR